MKTLSFILGFFLSMNLSAQKMMNAEENIKMIDRGEVVNLNGVTIDGILDFTDLENRQQERGNKDSFFSTIDVALTFIDCTFSDDVLAFYCEDRSDKCYQADFKRQVTFINCKFQEETSFKYSEFSREAVFTGNTFSHEANFKYSKFRKETSFLGCNFREEANFKYTEFSAFVNFHEARFMDEASFKYTKFPQGAMFSNVHFYEEVDFKYTKYSGDVVFEGAQFDGEVDQKYSHILKRDR